MELFLLGFLFILYVFFDTYEAIYGMIIVSALSMIKEIVRMVLELRIENDKIIYGEDENENDNKEDKKNEAVISN